MTNLAIFFGDRDIRAGVPALYLAVPGIIAVGPDDYRANRECSRCERNWREHGWLVYARSSDAILSVLDCSEMPRAGSGPS